MRGKESTEVGVLLSYHISLHDRLIAIVKQLNKTARMRQE